MKKRFLVMRRRLIEVIETSAVIADSEVEARRDAQAGVDWREVRRDADHRIEPLAIIEERIDER